MGSRLVEPGCNIMALFAASGKTPFIYTGADPGLFTEVGSTVIEPFNLYFTGEKLHLETGNAELSGPGYLKIYDIYGTLIGKIAWNSDQRDIDIKKITGSNSVTPGIYIAVLQLQNRTIKCKLALPGN